MGEQVSIGIVAITTLLLAGAILGRVHGPATSSVKPIGDRVMCGLLALPLISLLVHLTLPTVHLAWALAAAAPMAIYTVLLAGTDLGWTISSRHFTKALVVAVGAVYLIGIVALVACLTCACT